MAEISEATEKSHPQPERFPKLRKLGDLISYVSTQLGALALVLIMIICGLNVVARYFFHHAFSWAEEAMVFLMIFVIFSASAAVTWKGAHMHLDMLVKKFPKPARAAMNILTTCFSSALLLLLAWNSYDVVSKLFRFGQHSEALEVPMWIPQSFLLVGVIVIVVMMILRLVVFGAAAEGVHLESEDIL